MPISDSEPYSAGHFKRVYEHIIKPACEGAGFTPIRADDIQNTNYIALDVVDRIIKSEMAICDLSSRNPNVLYELGIRQAFNLPVTLIKDSRTTRIFDIQGFRDIEYDETLRIDNVNETREALQNTLQNTFESKGNEINSLISLLSIQPAQVSEKIEISKDTDIILNAINNLGSRLSELEKFVPKERAIIPAVPNELQMLDNNGILNLESGDVIYHQKFGKGTVTNIIGKDNKKASPVLTVIFDEVGEKKLVMNYAKLYRRL